MKWLLINGTNRVIMQFFPAINTSVESLAGPCNLEETILGRTGPLDVNGDGRPNLLFRYQSNSPSGSTYALRLYDTNNLLGIKWQRTVPGAPLVVGVESTNQQSRLRVVTLVGSGYDSESKTYNSRSLIQLNGSTGKIQWTYDLGSGPAIGFKFVDWDSQGTRAILVQDGASYSVFDGVGKKLWSLTAAIPDGSVADLPCNLEKIGLRDFVFTDVNGDGGADFLLANRNSDASNLQLYDIASQRQTWHRAMGGVFSVCLHKNDAAPQQIVFFGGYQGHSGTTFNGRSLVALDGATGDIKWTVNLGNGQTAVNPVIVDLNRDGHFQIAIQHDNALEFRSLEDGTLAYQIAATAPDATGKWTLINSLPWENELPPSNKRYLGDTDLDGSSDLIFVLKEAGGAIAIQGYDFPTKTFKWQTLIPSKTAADFSLTMGEFANNAAQRIICVTGTTNSGSKTHKSRMISCFNTAMSPAITDQPQGQVVCNGTNNVLLTASATGTLPLSYQWQCNSTNIPHATNSSFGLTNALVANGGTYRLVVKNSTASTTSSNAVLTVYVPVSIVQQPTNRIAAALSTATFTVAAAGTSPLKYQWLWNGTNLVGKQTNVLTLAGVAMNSEGNYSVIVSNAYTCVTSASASLTVIPPPSILQPPQSVTNLVGSSATFSVLADGRAPLSYQWQSNNVALAGATNSVLTLRNLQQAMACAYKVIVKNGLGSTNSATATLTTFAPPVITQQPKALNIVLSSNATFSVVATGTAPLTYQWFKDENPINGATNSSYTLSKVQGTNAGTYDVVVNNGAVAANLAPSAFSSGATLTVIFPPSFTSQPLSTNLSKGSNVLFAASVTGTEPLYYHWQFNGTNISHATNSSFGLNNVQLTNAGNYRVVVSNRAAVITSSKALLTVYIPAVITQHPTDLTVNAAGTAVFSVVATGTPTPSFQWQRNGTNLSKKTTSVLTLTNVDASEGGTYSVTVSNQYSGAASLAASLKVLPLTPIITAPGDNLRTNVASLLVRGTAGTNSGVTGVWCQLNDYAPQLASGTVNWTNAVVLVPGTNTFRAWTTNDWGQSAQTARHFFMVQTNLLTIITNGLGKVISTSGQNLEIGRNYTVSAVAGANQAFSNWVAVGLSRTTCSTTNYTFLMESNLVLTANFIPNPYLAAPGSYSGLFAPTNSLRQQANSGFFSFMIGNDGTIKSGKLLYGSTNVALSGKFDISGQALLTSGSLTTRLQLDFANQEVSGSVSNAAFTASLQGDLSVFSSTNTATNFMGQYTLVIPGTNDAAFGPFGASYATVKVDSIGNITMVGYVADGTAISQSSVVSKDGFWPCYASLHTNGSLWGWCLFTNHTIVAAPSLSWINPTNTASTAFYRRGFTNQELTVISSPFVSNSPLLNLANKTVILSGGNLPFTLTNYIIYTTDDAINTVQTNKLTLTVNKTNGVISGSFVSPTNSKQTNKISGVLLQNQTNAAGYFLGTNQSGLFLLQTNPPTGFIPFD